MTSCPVFVGDDRSESAARAVAWARALANERAMRLITIHVDTGSGEPSALLHTDDGGEDERIALPDRHAASAIMEIAAHVDAALIVLGRRGAGGFPSLPIGTTAHVVAASCGRPVVVVPPSFEQVAQPLVRRVVVGLDGLPGSTAAASCVTTLVPEADFVVVHALDLGPVLAYTEAGDATAYDRLFDRAVARTRDQWRQVVGDERAAEFVVEEGGAAEVLLSTATRTNADLVVVGRREHPALSGTLGGISQRILAYAPCPAMLVPTGEAHTPPDAT